MADEVIAGRYRLEKRLGKGGMSEVWSALDLDLERRVAVKLLAPPADRTRFEREARAAAALAHPNICTLYTYGETGDRPFMVLEYLPGGSLEDRLAPGQPLPDRDTRRIALEIASGLAHAHERGLVHRDLKPSNVLFDAGGRAKIADFGIARLGGGDGLTAAGTVLGTAAYISPEQAAGDEATPASDVYAFGVILYRMLSGRLPFESSDALAMVALHRDEPPPPLATLRPDAPARLESVAMAALSKSPVDRPRDGAALLGELETAAPLPGETTATQVLQPEPARRRGRTAVVIVAAALLAAAGVALALAVTFGGKTSAPPSTSTSTPTPAPATAPTTAPVAPPPTLPATTSTEEATSTAEPSTTAAEPTTSPTTAPALTTVPVTTSTSPPPPPATTVPPPTTTETTPTDTTSTDTATTTTAAPVAPE